MVMVCSDSCTFLLGCALDLVFASPTDDVDLDEEIFFLPFCPGLSALAEVDGWVSTATRSFDCVQVVL